MATETTGRRGRIKMWTEVDAAIETGPGRRVVEVKWQSINTYILR